jgi:hypothetical protein
MTSSTVSLVSAIPEDAVIKQTADKSKNIANDLDGNLKFINSPFCIAPRVGGNDDLFASDIEGRIPQQAPRTSIPSVTYNSRLTFFVDYCRPPARHLGKIFRGLRAAQKRNARNENDSLRSFVSGASPSTVLVGMS